MTSAPPGRATIAGTAPYVLTVGAVVLGWQIAIQPLMQRAPVETAVRIAPASPLVLRRAAESELAAGRHANAAALGREALGRAPFDVRALRVVGLTEARAGRVEAADQMLTLAGNWSLRDDPAHAWLVEHRLRRGDYASSFAHADTLVRRRQDIQPQVFQLFTVAAVEDRGRALPVIAGLLAARPPWRSAYLTSLYETAEGLQVAAGLAIMLEASRAPMTTVELRQLYMRFLAQGHIDAVKTVRARLNRPPPGTVTNGDFEDPDAPEPFQWQLIQKAGASSAIVADDSGRGNSALRVEYDGYTGAVLARQQTFLAPGRYRFGVTSRVESGDQADLMEWTIACASGGDPVLSVPALSGTDSSSNAWLASTAVFSVNADCPSQWLELRGRPLDSRTPTVTWFDQVSIVRLEPTTN